MEKLLASLLMTILRLPNEGGDYSELQLKSCFMLIKIQELISQKDYDTLVSCCVHVLKKVVGSKSSIKMRKEFFETLNSFEKSKILTPEILYKTSK